MTTRKTGLADEVKLEDSSGNDLTDIGYFQTASHDISINSETLSAIGSGAKAVDRLDQPMEVSGDLSLRTTDLIATRLIGEYSEPTASTWRVDFSGISNDDKLPEFKYFQQISNSQTLVMGGWSYSSGTISPEPGFKFTSATLTIEQEGAVELEFEGLGTYAEIQDTTISTTLPSSLGMANWIDASVRIDGTAVGSLDTVEVSIDRNGEVVRGIESRVRDTRLLPDEVIEQELEIEFTLTIEVSDVQSWEELFQQTSFPLQPEGERSERQIEVDLGDNSSGNNVRGTLVLENALPDSVEGELSDDKDIRTVTLSGKTRTAHAEGDQ